jgi:hypothetical protein
MGRVAKNCGLITRDEIHALISTALPIRMFIDSREYNRFVTVAHCINNHDCQAL